MDRQAIGVQGPVCFSQGHIDGPVDQIRRHGVGNGPAVSGCQRDRVAPVAVAGNDAHVCVPRIGVLLLRLEQDQKILHFIAVEVIGEEKDRFCLVDRFCSSCRKRLIQGLQLRRQGLERKLLAVGVGCGLRFGFGRLLLRGGLGQVGRRQDRDVLGRVGNG